MQYEIVDLPDNLPPGKYQTRVLESSSWINENGRLALKLKVQFAGPYDSDNPCLLPLTVHDRSEDGRQPPTAR